MLKYILPILLSFALAVPCLAQGYASPGQPPGGTNGQLQYNNSGVFGGTTALPSGTTATTPSQGDSSTKVSTTSYTDTAVTNAIAGVNPAVAVDAASNAILPNSPAYSNGVAGVGATITSTALTALVVDGYTVALGDRVLVKNEVGGGGLGALANGIYTQTTLGSGAAFWVLTRASDYNSAANMNETGAIPVITGTANTTTTWVLTSKVTTVGVSALTYSQFSYAPSTIQQNTAAALSTSNIAQFGGDGSDGATSLATDTSYTLKQFNATTITTSGTHTSTLLGCILNASTSITLSANATLTDTSGVAGGAAQGSASSNGIPAAGCTLQVFSGGTGAQAVGPGGSGGANGGAACAGGGGASPIAAGGNSGGASATANVGTGQGGVPLQGTQPQYRIGYGGGSSGTGASGASGAGGNGGGCIRMYSPGAISVGSGAAVNCVGTTGGNGTTLAGGSGGGGGGSQWYFSKTSMAFGTAIASVAGGAGGNGAGTNTDGGGGGGGGLIYAMSPSNSGTNTVAGGGAGTQGASGTVGNAGSNGTYVNNSGTPNLPTIVYLEDMRGLRSWIALERGKRWMYGQDPGGEIATNYVRQDQWLAAWYAKPGEYQNLCMALMYGGDDSAAEYCFDAPGIKQGFANHERCAISPETGIKQLEQTCGGLEAEECLEPSV